MVWQTETLSQRLGNRGLSFLNAFLLIYFDNYISKGYFSSSEDIPGCKIGIWNVIPSICIPPKNRERIYNLKFSKINSQQKGSQEPAYSQEVICLLVSQADLRLACELYYNCTQLLIFMMQLKMKNWIQVGKGLSLRISELFLIWKN